MSWIKVVFLSIAVGGAVLPIGVVRAQSSPFIGRWHLNIGQSTPPQGEILPADLSTDISRLDDMHVHWSTTITDAKGMKSVETFDTPGNGEFYSLDSDTMVSHRLSLNRVQSTFKDANGQMDVLTCTLSNDARKLNCSGVITHQDGSVVTYVDVFDRV